jgi:hypothetical protein
MLNLVQHYNMSTDQMYSDFIAKGDGQAYDFAQSKVKGLKASYKQKVKLEEQYPDAEIRVVIYQDKEKDIELGFEDSWYRDQIVFLENEDFIEYSKLEKSGNLDKVEFVLTKLHEVGTTWGDQSVSGWLSIRDDTYRNEDGTYRCGNIERVSFDDKSFHYEVHNIVPTIDFNTIDECTNGNLDTPYARWFSVRHKDEGITYTAEFGFRETQELFNLLPEWINVEGKADTLNATEVINTLLNLPYAWSDEVHIDTEIWRKRLVEGKIIIDKDSTGKWVKSTTQDDDTTVYECSNDGIVWEDCEG